MSSQTSSSGPSAWIAGVALVVAILSLLLQWIPGDATPTPPANMPDLRAAVPVAPPPDAERIETTSRPPGDWSDLIDRVEQLEARSKEWSSGPDRAEAPAGSVATPTIGDWLESLQALEIRVTNLESEQRQAREAAKGLVAPDAIPSTLAVLLASRGVITKVGDIEALQANMGALGGIVADGTAKDWDRIEAYRGMLMFGYESPDACVAAMPGLAALLMNSGNDKARQSAAGLLSTYKNPSIAATLMAAYQREQVESVRAAIIGSMLQLSEDPGVRQTLQSAVSRERDQELVKRIRRTLSK